MKDDPTGKRALFEGHVNPPPEADGKRALFSAGEPVAAHVIVECSRCGVTSRIDPLDAALRVLSLSLWIPGRSYSRRLRCPHCRRRSWVRLGYDPGT